MDGDYNYDADANAGAGAGARVAVRSDDNRRRSTVMHEVIPSQLEPDPDSADEKEQHARRSMVVPQPPLSTANANANGNTPAKKTGTLRRAPPAAAAPLHDDLHYSELAVATLTLVVGLAEVVTDAALLWEYRDKYGVSGDVDANGHDDARNNFVALLVLRALHALVHILFDYINRGRVRYALLDLLQLRVVVEWVLYVKDWCVHHRDIAAQGAPLGSGWTDNADFRSDVTFESFMYSLPSLIVQTHWIVTDERAVTGIQIGALFVTSVQGLIGLIHVFKYVSVGASAYFAMCVKAVLTTLLRTILVALLLHALKLWAVIWIVASLLVGGALYFGSVMFARTYHRDDPLQHWLCHTFYGALIGLNALFVSFPFAPTRCVTDWWLGYLVSELKMQIESVAMFVVAVGLYWGDTERHDSPAQFWVVCGFAFAMAVANAVTLLFLHHHANRVLRRRKAYSTDLIIDLFNYVCAHLQRRLTHTIRELQPHVSPAMPRGSATVAVSVALQPHGNGYGYGNGNGSAQDALRASTQTPVEPFRADGSSPIARSGAPDAVPEQQPYAAGGVAVYDPNPPLQQPINTDFIQPPGPAVAGGGGSAEPDPHVHQPMY